MKAFVKRADLLLIFGLLFLCGLLLLPRLTESRTAEAVVTCKGEVLYRIDLSAVKSVDTIPLDTDPHVVLQVEPHAIRFLEADCPDRLCVKSGSLSHVGDTAACLPARTVVSIVGAHSSGEADIMTY